MSSTCIGGGPAGLHVTLAMKRADFGGEITVVERDRRDNAFSRAAAQANRSMEA